MLKDLDLFKIEIYDYLKKIEDTSYEKDLTELEKEYIKGKIDAVNEIRAILERLNKNL